MKVCKFAKTKIKIRLALRLAQTTSVKFQNISSTKTIYTIYRLRLNVSFKICKNLNFNNSGKFCPIEMKKGLK